jgi:outer membrane protein OmpA-like peptidoglycan-associated protein
MRHPFLLAGFLLLIPAAAHAQVTIDLRALDALPQIAPSAPPRRIEPRPAPRPAPASTSPTPTSGATATALPTPPVPPAATTTTATATPATPTPAGQAAVPATPAPPVAPPAATLPAAPPPMVAIAPIPPPVLPSAPTPPPAPPVSITSATTAAPESSGVQLTFKTGESDLSPEANAALGKLVKATPPGDTISYNVVAYAAGSTDDPSVARRTSLARGLAVRGALIAAGVPSTRIYVRALGSATGDGPPDRVDVTVLGLSGAAATKP